MRGLVHGDWNKRRPWDYGKAAMGPQEGSGGHAVSTGMRKLKVTSPPADLVLPQRAS